MCSMYIPMLFFMIASAYLLQSRGRTDIMWAIAVWACRRRRRRENRRRRRRKRRRRRAIGGEEVVAE